MQFGLGAIAKGFTLEELYTFFHDNGVNNFIINAGGDIIVSGSKFSDFWTTSILNPNAKQAIAVCKFKNIKMAIVSSGSYFRYFTIKDKKYSHIINLKTGYPSKSDIISISIIAQNASLADAYATALFSQGFKNVKNKFQDLASSGIGVIINNSSKTKMNSFAKKYCY